MIQWSLLYIICALFMSSGLVHAENEANNEDAELIKLRIKELELKKEILELETRKQEKSSTQNSMPQSYVKPPSSTYSPSSSSYFRGPRGGCYTYSKSGNKRYVDRSLCN
ncbi:hypothetical protein Meth11DRAFT_2119 [Methylophilaceae bacterium 11]|nr:hypothetical protein Meth11DRAFT_2119 [Methylophilaceae bacterium 11]